MEISNQIRQRVAGAKVARLATVRPDGTPHVQPVTFALSGETFVTAVDHKPKRTPRLQRLRNIEVQPAVSLVVDHYADDWSQLWWVRADGVARIVTEGEDHQRASSLLAAKYEQYRAHPIEGPVIEIAVQKWTAWP